jgi:hypothetical protein
MILSSTEMQDQILYPHQHWRDPRTRNFMHGKKCATSVDMHVWVDEEVPLQDD